jgi:hypothetical protein
VSIAALLVAGVGGGSSAYAVVISRRALRREEERDATKITISFGHVTAFKNFPRILSLDRPIPPDPMFYELAVNVINGGATTEFVKTLWIESGEDGIDLSPENDIELQPHERWVRTLDVNELPVGAAEHGFVAKVHLANGDEIVGQREVLVNGLRETAETHNRDHGI